MHLKYDNKKVKFIKKYVEMCEKFIKKFKIKMFIFF